ncbi:hypothetical protein PQC65_gp105 [Aeromonas phage pAEv1810]|uniref:hypothetical protein n=1 Tax=Aeromonas phage pAEv1810 TaxID=2908744 RepID=UPI0023294D62|nr:hypothetical protein PQC65_gp105 [Aeromonas phage pAEv1810]UIS25043.1 hypothetical protein pAEv1810_105 [Aeromonas phage pAEv1810]
MSIYEMLVWVVAIVVAVYLIIGIYHLIKLINWKLPEYLSEAGVTKQNHVKVALWLIVVYTVCDLLVMLASPFM